MIYQINSQHQITKHSFLKRNLICQIVYIYIFSIILQDENGENFTLEASYEIETNNEKQKEKDEETPWLIIAFRIIIIIIIIMVFLFKIGHLYFEFEDKDTESRKEFNRKEKED